MKRGQDLECADNGGALDLLAFRHRRIQSAVALRLPAHSKYVFQQPSNGESKFSNSQNNAIFHKSAILGAFDWDGPSMKKHILIYGVCGGLLIVALKLIEYRFLVIERSIEIYGGLIALMFASVGIWVGLKLTKPKETVLVKEVHVPSHEPFILDQAKLQQLGITAREFEILQLIAGGMSNREIAEKLFVSENTVKTHSSRLFDKLSAKRRTQAVQIAKELRLIP
jgi:two-component system, NarL family, response regulator LiaR